MFPRYGLGEAPIEQQQAPPDSLFNELRAEAGPSEEVSYYVWKRSLTALQAAPDLAQFIDGDSDFLLTAIYGRSTSTFTLNIRDASGRLIYSAEADSRNVIGTAQFPVPLRPALWYPAAGKIGISITDTSNAANEVEIVFAGIRRFKTR